MNRSTLTLSNCLSVGQQPAKKDGWREIVTPSGSSEKKVNDLFQWLIPRLQYYSINELAQVFQDSVPLCITYPCSNALKAAILKKIIFISCRLGLRSLVNSPHVAACMVIKTFSSCFKIDGTWKSSAFRVVHEAARNETQPETFVEICQLAFSTLFSHPIDLQKAVIYHFAIEVRMGAFNCLPLLLNWVRRGELPLQHMGTLIEHLEKFGTVNDHLEVWRMCRSLFVENHRRKFLHAFQEVLFRQESVLASKISAICEISPELKKMIKKVKLDTLDVNPGDLDEKLSCFNTLEKEELLKRISTFELFVFCYCKRAPSECSFWVEHALGHPFKAESTISWLLSVATMDASIQLPLEFFSAVHSKQGIPFFNEMWIACLQHKVSPAHLLSLLACGAENGHFNSFPKDVENLLILYFDHTGHKFCEKLKILQALKSKLSLLTMNCIVLSLIANFNGKFSFDDLDKLLDLLLAFPRLEGSLRLMLQKVLSTEPTVTLDECMHMGLEGYLALDAKAAAVAKIHHESDVLKNFRVSSFSSIMTLRTSAERLESLKKGSTRQKRGHAIDFGLGKAFLLQKAPFEKAKGIFEALLQLIAKRLKTIGALSLTDESLLKKINYTSTLFPEDSL